MLVCRHDACARQEEVKEEEEKAQLGKAVEDTHQACRCMTDIFL
jgi:hypothetical protein